MVNASGVPSTWLLSSWSFVNQSPILSPRTGLIYMNWQKFAGWPIEMFVVLSYQSGVSHIIFRLLISSIYDCKLALHELYITKASSSRRCTNSSRALFVFAIPVIPLPAARIVGAASLPSMMDQALSAKGGNGCCCSRCHNLWRLGVCTTSSGV